MSTFPRLLIKLTKSLRRALSISPETAGVFLAVPHNQLLFCCMSSPFALYSLFPLHLRTNFSQFRPQFVCTRYLHLYTITIKPCFSAHVQYIAIPLWPLIVPLLASPLILSLFSYRYPCSQQVCTYLYNIRFDLKLAILV